MCASWAKGMSVPSGDSHLDVVQLIETAAGGFLETNLQRVARLAFYHLPDNRTADGFDRIEDVGCVYAIARHRASIDFDIYRRKSLARDHFDVGCAGKGRK